MAAPPSQARQQAPMHFGGGADIETTGRLMRHYDTRVAQDRAPQQKLLQVTADRLRAGHLHARMSDAEAGKDTRR